MNRSSCLYSSKKIVYCFLPLYSVQLLSFWSHVHSVPILLEWHHQIEWHHQAVIFALEISLILELWLFTDRSGEMSAKAEHIRTSALKPWAEHWVWKIYKLTVLWMCPWLPSLTEFYLWKMLWYFIKIMQYKVLFMWIMHACVWFVYIYIWLFDNIISIMTCI